MGANWITRGILIGGSLGALATAMGVSSMPYFISIGFGAIAGMLAGLTRTFLANRRTKK